MVNETEGEIDTGDHKESYSSVDNQDEGGINVVSNDDRREHTSSTAQMNDHQIVDESKCNGEADNYKKDDLLVVVDHQQPSVANDTPLINKSDLILINVCNATKNNEEEEKEDKEKGNEISLVNLANAKQEEDVKIDGQKENCKQMETKIEVNVKSEDESATNDGNSMDTIVKIDDEPKSNPKAESNGIHSDDVKEEKSDDKKQCSDESEAKSPNSDNKKSFWSRMWRSKQSTDSTSRSQETDIEVIESPSNEKKANSSGNNSDTTTDVTVAICTETEPQKKLDENELTPTHLLFRVKSPYFKYIFSFTIFALLILLFAAAAIYLFPEKFDIRYLNLISGRSVSNDTITTTVTAQTVNEEFDAITTSYMEGNMIMNTNTSTTTNISMNTSIANTESDRIAAFNDNATAYYNA